MFFDAPSVRVITFDSCGVLVTELVSEEQSSVIAGLQDILAMQQQWKGNLPTEAVMSNLMSPFIYAQNTSFLLEHEYCFFSGLSAVCLYSGVVFKQHPSVRHYKLLSHGLLKKV